MLILVHVDREALVDMLADWHPCQGVRFQEREDGTFTLLGTQDIDTARIEDDYARTAALINGAIGSPSERLDDSSR